MARHPCKVCGGKLEDEAVRCREMMFGLREVFDYLRCTKCGCLQIAEIPSDIARHYPSNYYSLGSDSGPDAGFKSDDLRMKIRRMLTNLRLKQGGVLKVLAEKFPKGAPMPHWMQFLALPVHCASRILDVGCGNGLTLLKLRHCGFSDLTGADPYLDAPKNYDGGVRILKCGVEDIHETFDVVMLHHVFEHMDNPVSMLKAISRLISPGGQLLIRIPMYDSEAAAKYGVDWYQIDAPRHFFLHTRRSMQNAAEQAGLKIARVTYDSTEAQFWASEQYKLDIPLMSAKTEGMTMAPGRFSDSQLDQWRKLSEEFNRDQKGDQACFVLTSAK
jgi:SAM-dependent methyltransferase